MADARGGSPAAFRAGGTVAHPARSDDHASHDLLLVAEAADRDGHLPVALAACPACVALHADLVALAAAIPDATLPTRPRAYLLTPADAARLRRRGWRRWLAAIGTSRDAVSRPLALGLTTLGIAGLLVTTLPGVLPGGGATSGALAPVGVESVDGTASDAPTRAMASSDDSQAKSGGPSPLAVVSGSFLLAGAGLLLARRAAR